MTALTPLEVIRIERAAFRNLLRKEPNLAIGLLEGMARRTRKILDSPQAEPASDTFFGTPPGTPA